MRFQSFIVSATLALPFFTTAQSFNNLPVTTQKPPLHGRHWMAVTGKPLAATAGAMNISKAGKSVYAILFRKFHQFRQAHVECPGYFVQTQDGNIFFPSFNSPNIIPVEFAGMSQLFFRNIRSNTHFFDPFSYFIQKYLFWFGV